MGITVPSKQREEVERQLHRTDLTRRMRERRELVQAAALGDEVERIARWGGRSVARVEHWLARYAEAGVEALADAPRSGRSVRADAAYLAAMEAALETAPSALGLPIVVWTSERLAASLEQQTGIHIAPGWLRVLLAEQGWMCGRPKHTLKHRQDRAAGAVSRAELEAVGGKGGAKPEKDELHVQDETQLETTPHLCRTWHRKGQQPTLPAGGTNRRVTVCGSVDVLGRARVELVRATQDSAGCVRDLELLEAHHQAMQREIYLVLDNGSAHTSTLSMQALAQRRDWRLVIWLATYAPHLTPNERAWRSLKRDARSHRATTLRNFVDGILSGLRHFGATVATIVDEVPQWFLDGHRKPPTGRPPGRPVGAKDSYKRAPYRRKQNLAAGT
jgi:transposase